MKKMNVKSLLLANTVVLAMSLGLTSCMGEWKSQRILSNGPKVTETRPLKGFEEIEISGSPRVCYTQADSFSVQVRGPQEAVDNILTDVEGKTLTIRNRGKIHLVNISFDEDDGLTVYVTSPDLTSIRLNGSGDFEAQDQIDTDRMDVILRGSGDIDMKSIICDHCDVELIGSGDISLSHLDALEASVTLVGSGDISLGLHRARKTQLSLKGSGDINANFREDCEAVECELRGSGDISLKGTVRKFNQHKSGSGDIDFERLAVK